jgi:hypothetical protein
MRFYTKLINNSQIICKGNVLGEDEDFNFKKCKKNEISLLPNSLDNN